MNLIMNWKMAIVLVSSFFEYTFGLNKFISGYHGAVTAGVGPGYFSLLSFIVMSLQL